jgi:hypothetical protein
MSSDDLTTLFTHLLMSLVARRAIEMACLVGSIETSFSAFDSLAARDYASK